MITCCANGDNIQAAGQPFIAHLTSSPPKPHPTSANLTMGSSVLPLLPACSLCCCCSLKTAG
jgi:hypothetical protein